MNYPEELRERYNSVMFDERDIIEKFLKDQYDLRYGHQRDTWHFEPSISLLGHYGLCLNVTDIKLDNDKFVTFTAKDPIDGNVTLECTEFAYGELSKVIEALPDVNNIMIDNAKSDIARMCNGSRINLESNPFNTFVNGLGFSIWSVDYEDGHIKAYTYTGKNVMDETNTGLVLGLRNHISIEVLHRSKEYKELMELLSLQENLRFECHNFGDAEFTIDETNIILDVSAVQRDDKGNLVIYGADVDADENITLTEKEIKPQYLASIIECMKPKYTDIIDTYNGHNAELVRIINAAWKDGRYHDLFGEILLALLIRDHEEYIEKYGEVDDYSVDWAMEHAHEIMEGVCDDLDLKTILSFIRYEEY